MKKVVVFGGGTGQSIILRGLKQIPDISISTIVTVADDGGSTGRIRDQYFIPAMGDIRNVMVSLAKEESVISSLMSYRFTSNSDSELFGHNLGNIMLLALTDITGSFLEAIHTISRIMNVAGEIIPSSLQVVTLFAEMEDGTIVKGESNIPEARNHIKRIFYEDDVHASQDAIRAIQEADLIIYGIGSLFTSIIPNLIIPEIKAAIQASKAKKVYYCNVMSQEGETDGFTSEDHVNAIMRHVEDKIDYMVVASDDIPEECVDHYRSEHQEMIQLSSQDHSYEVIKHSLLGFEGNQIRHDADKLRTSIFTFLD